MSHYLFVSASAELSKFKKLECGSDYLYAPSFKSIWTKVQKYAKNYAYPPNEPNGVFKYDKRHGAVIEKYCGDLIGWIYKL